MKARFALLIALLILLLVLSVACGASPMTWAG
jgi:hypothetical protein